jgi:ABC-2 type transport system ATP-binding protein
MLLGLIAPSAGRWSVLGDEMPSPGLRTLLRVGAMVEGPAFYPWLSGRANLARFDAAGPDGRRRSRASRIDEALARVGLTVAAGRKYRTYSLGMRQRLGLAGALLRPRDLLVLDEPTNGMDPQGTREIRTLVRELAAEGTTVFLSSHLLSEVEQVCSHVAVMANGRILAQGPLAEIRSAGTARLRCEVDNAPRAVNVLEALGLGDIEVQGDQVSALLGDTAPERCNRQLVEAGVGVRALFTERPSLEDLFVALTGEGFDVAR